MRQCYALLAAAALFVSPLLVESVLGQQPAAPAAGAPAAQGGQAGGQGGGRQGQGGAQAGQGEGRQGGGQG
ncbi:MAG: hypothetical protein ACRD3G_22565, partial [Vicinamibacterales bacterium]